uniref:Uncharacterized protein n=1 Tax=Timema cristinae TaxID=61476 RepID=A0A7R9GPP1_TIMCR|nr:unnamed protein product [Timema cristinae]
MNSEGFPAPYDPPPWKQERWVMVDGPSESRWRKAAALQPSGIKICSLINGFGISASFPEVILVLFCIKKFDRHSFEIKYFKEISFLQEPLIIIVKYIIPLACSLDSLLLFSEPNKEAKEFSQAQLEETNILRAEYIFSRRIERVKQNFICHSRNYSITTLNPRTVTAHHQTRHSRLVNPSRGQLLLLCWESERTIGTHDVRMGGRVLWIPVLVTHVHQTGDSYQVDHAKISPAYHIHELELFVSYGSFEKVMSLDIPFQGTHLFTFLPDEEPCRSDLVSKARIQDFLSSGDSLFKYCSTTTVISILNSGGRGADESDLHAEEKIMLIEPVGEFSIKKRVFDSRCPFRLRLSSSSGAKNLHNIICGKIPQELQSIVREFLCSQEEHVNGAKTGSLICERTSNNVSPNLVFSFCYLSNLGAPQIAGPCAAASLDLSIHNDYWLNTSGSEYVEKNAHYEKFKDHMNVVSGTNNPYHVQGWIHIGYTVYNCDLNCFMIRVCLLVRLALFTPPSPLIRSDVFISAGFQFFRPSSDHWEMGEGGSPSPTSLRGSVPNYATLPDN